METYLIKPRSFEVPGERGKRLAYAKKMVLAGAVITVIQLAIAIWALIASDDTGGVFVLFGMVAISLGIVIRGLYHYSKYAKFDYTVKGVKVTFESEKYYVPSPRMKALVSAVQSTWRDIGLNATEIYKGVSLTILDRRPRDPLNRIDHKRMVGLTYHNLRASKAWGAYALSPSGAGYELMLHGAEARWPGSDEAQKVERMLELDLFTALEEKYADEIAKLGLNN